MVSLSAQRCALVQALRRVPSPNMDGRHRLFTSPTTVIKFYDNYRVSNTGKDAYY